MQKTNFKNKVTIAIVFGFFFLVFGSTAHATEVEPPPEQPPVFATSSDPLPDPLIIEQTTATPTPTEDLSIPTTTEPVEITPIPTPLQTISQTQISDTINKILNYFKTQQSSDGKIVDGTITDWAIMSFGAQGEYADDIKQANGQSLLDYEKKYNLDDPSDINSCATYPRHILALLAAGVNINDSSIQGLKDKMLTVCYKDNLYGLNGTNDDVFALLALLAAEENTQNPIVISTINTIVSDQTAGGSFTWAGYPSADITGASINALKYAQTKGAEINNGIFTNAKIYLKSTQQTDGGWGCEDYPDCKKSDVLTTSWALMGINALNEGQNEWFTASGTNPWYILVNKLNADGYYELWGQPDWFGLKHAVPALAGKSWPIIMPEKIQNFSQGATFTYGGGGHSYISPPILTPTTTATTTTIASITIPTSTLITTSTSTTSTIEIVIGSDATSTTKLDNTKKHTTTPPLITKKIFNNRKYEKISPGNLTCSLRPSDPFRTPLTQLYRRGRGCIFCWPLSTQ